MGDPPVKPGLIRIATRASDLAMAQARCVAEALSAPAELVPMVTRGDRTKGSLTAEGGKGLFVEGLERAIRRGEAHIAVHSAKDVPVELAGDMTIAAVPAREDPRDALVVAEHGGLEDLTSGARVGTASRRRAAAIRAARADLEVVPMRGNVDTRLAKLRGGEVDAIVVAMAGLIRLKLVDKLAGRLTPLDVTDFVPAAGQGALAVECLTQDCRTAAAVQPLNGPASAAALAAERSVVRSLGADCHSAVGVHVYASGRAWRGLAMVADPAGESIIRAAAEGSEAEAVGRELLDRLCQAGAEELMKVRPPSIE